MLCIYTAYIGLGKVLIRTGLATYAQSNWFNGDLTSSDGTVATVWAADYNDAFGAPRFAVGIYSLPPSSYDADIFYVSGQWWKIKAGRVELSTDSAGKVSIKGKFGAVVYPIDGENIKTKIMEKLTDGNGPAKLIRDANNALEEGDIQRDGRLNDSGDGVGGSSGSGAGNERSSNADRGMSSGKVTICSGMGAVKGGC